MRYFREIFIILYLLLSVTACITYKQRAKGVENRIVVVTSPEDQPFISSAFKSVFDRVIHTPEPEPYFEMEYKDPSDFNNLKYHHNIIVISLFTPQDTTGDVLVRSILPESQIELAIRGENQVFATRNYFARDQVFVILAVNNEKDLIQLMQERGQWLFNQFDSAFIERMRKHVFKTMEQRKLSKKFKERYGWYMRFQHDYVIIREKPEENFVWLGRSFPYRWLSVHWIENPPVKKLDSQIVIELVRNLPEVFYKKVRFTDYYQRMEETPLNRWTAWRVEGLWEHKSEVRGGPFMSYIFYDLSSDRLFHINFLLFHPGSKKILLLRQMETMVHTFSVESS